MWSEKHRESSHRERERSCDNCGRRYKSSATNTKYCSPACRTDYNQKKRIYPKKVVISVGYCEICGRPFFKKTKALCCSKECLSKKTAIKDKEYRARKFPAGSREPKIRTVTCVECKTQFETHRPNTKCCSDECLKSRKNRLQAQRRPKWSSGDGKKAAEKYRLRYRSDADFREKEKRRTHIQKKEVPLWYAKSQLGYKAGDEVPVELVLLKQAQIRLKHLIKEVSEER